MTIYMLAPGPNITFSGTPSGLVYESDRNSMIFVTTGGAPDQVALQEAGCQTLSNTLITPEIIIATGGWVAFDTLAHLNADLNYAAGTYARVLFDSTSSNNGIYEKLGNSGTGSWSYLGQDPAATSETAASASASAAAASAVTAADAITSLFEDVPQVVGTPGDPVTGTAMGNASTWVWTNPAQGAGVLQSLTAYVQATGTIDIAAYTLSGSTLTRTATASFSASATGLQTFTPTNFGTFDVPAGGYLAMSANGVVAYLGSTPPSAQQVYGGPGNNCPASGPVGSLAAGVFIQAQWNLSVSVQTVTAATFAPAVGGGTLSLANVEKIVCVSNSYYAGSSCLLGKAITNVVSNLSEYNFGNFSIGGQTPTSLTTAMIDGDIVFGNAYADHNAAYALLSEQQNAKVNEAESDATYYAGYQSWIDTARGMGAIAVVATEYGMGDPASYVQTVDGEQRNVRGLRWIADLNGLVFIDVTSKSRTMNPDAYAAFWESNHPGTRMIYLFADGLRRGLKQLPRPKQSMKIFRVRGTVSVSGPGSLMFETISERTHLFKELLLGQVALSEAYKVYYDTAIAIDTSDQTQVDEYLSMAAGNVVALGDYALIDCVLPVLNPTNVQLTISDPTCTVYVRQLGRSGSAWVELAAVDGAFPLATNDNPGVVDADRIAFLIYNSGGVSMVSSPVLSWSTGTPKLRPTPRVPAVPPIGAELLSQPLTVVSGAVPSAWTNAGSLPAVVPLDGAAYLPGANQSPPLTTGCVEVTSSNGISQAFTYPASDDPQEVVVRVWARRWVAIFPSTSSFASAPITYETCDTGTLQATVCGASGVGNASAPMLDQVGLAWTEVEFRSTLEATTTLATVAVQSLDYTLQIARISVRLAQ